MNKKLITLCLLILPGFTYSQLADDFSDGNLLQNPSWVGDTGQFMVNNSSQLQLNSSGDNVSYLATQCSFTDSIEWNLWIKLAFSPSDNNNTRIYLSSNSQDLKNSLNGYYLRLGESGSDDAIELFKQSGTVSTSVCRGKAGLLANSFEVRIKVTYVTSGDWRIYVDATGNNKFLPDATGNENSFCLGNWFGIVCRYTSSNSTKFYFDDFLIKKMEVDKVPPVLSGIRVVSSTKLDLSFDEAIDPATAGNISNYSANHSLGNPVSATRDTLDYSLVHLNFSSGFTTDLPYSLNISDVKDIAGNVMQPSQKLFYNHIIQSFDVLINEIMADPDPIVGLPDAEYIELYNRTAFDIDISKWTVSVGSSRKEITQAILKSKDYLVLTDLSSINLLNSYGTCIGVSGLSVPNTEGIITLCNGSGHVIHTVSYLDSWYRNNYKKEGGWSLEMIDPLNPCGGADNWTASNDKAGGTPGKVNSGNALNPDRKLPYALRAGVIDNMHIELWFSEPMDSTTIFSPASYSITDIGNPLTVQPTLPDYRKTVLLLPQPLQAGKIYYVTAMSTLKDCAGNTVIHNSRVQLGLATDAGMNDVIINEILFNPKAGCQDFVEIYNRSPKVIEMKNLVLANYDYVTRQTANVSEISKQSFLLFPGDYYVLSTDTASIKKFYYTANPDGFIQMDHFPTMNNESGNVAITSKTGTIIDQFSYTADMQYPMLLNIEGISLERINPEIPANGKLNWHSAAETVGFATPAYKNSQFAVAGKSEDNAIALAPEVFSPDNDGHNDVLTISYSLQEPGYNANVTIYDALGNLVRDLVNNELIGTSGTFVWDGLTNEKHKALIGRYIVWIEMFDLKGKVLRFKKTTVLGGKLG
jgi:hypothetical protein